MEKCEDQSSRQRPLLLYVHDRSQKEAARAFSRIAVEESQIRGTLITGMRNKIVHDHMGHVDDTLYGGRVVDELPPTDRRIEVDR